jgi:hypothetical protein
VSDLHNTYFRPLERLLSTELVGIDAFREATGLGRKWLARSVWLLFLKKISCGRPAFTGT